MSSLQYIFKLYSVHIAIGALVQYVALVGMQMALSTCISFLLFIILGSDTLNSGFSVGQISYS